MLVVEVDVGDAEAVQAGLAGLAHILRPAAQAGAPGLQLDPELGGHLHLLPRQLLQRLFKTCP